MAARHFTGDAPLSWQEPGPTKAHSYRGRHFSAAYDKDVEAEDLLPVPADLMESPSWQESGDEAPDWAKARVESLFLELSEEMFARPAEDVPAPAAEDVPASAVEEATASATEDALDAEEPPLEATRELDPDQLLERMERLMADEQVVERQRRERLEVGTYPAIDPSQSSSLGMTDMHQKKRPLALFATIGEAIARLLRLDER